MTYKKQFSQRYRQWKGFFYIEKILYNRVSGFEQTGLCSLTNDIKADFAKTVTAYEKRLHKKGVLTFLTLLSDDKLSKWQKQLKEQIK